MAFIACGQAKYTKLEGAGFPGILPLAPCFHRDKLRREKFILLVAKFVFLLLLWLKYFKMDASVKIKLESLNFQDRFDILLEKRPSGVAELRYKMLVSSQCLGKTTNS